jgi:hypothetical protein
LRGEEAPLASELENWLKENPGYVEVPRDEVSPVEDKMTLYNFRKVKKLKKLNLNPFTRKLEYGFKKVKLVRFKLNLHYNYSKCTNGLL